VTREPVSKRASAPLAAVIAAAILGAGGPVAAQQATSASTMKAGPSIRETGRVANTGVATPGIEIRDAHHDRTAAELPVDKAAPVERPTADAPGRIDQAVLAQQIRSRFAALTECPVEISRHQHVTRASAASGRFTLRWTILPTGRVAETAIVATSPANDRVMDCVKRQMNAWSFTPPEGGSVRLERPFRFGGRGPTTRERLVKAAGPSRN
jgi:hypothetical protein